MTRADILALKGRELDFAVQEWVFDNQWWTYTSINSTSLVPPELAESASWFTDAVPGRATGADVYCPLVPAYSTWEAYGQVFAEMERKGYTGELTRDFARFSHGTTVGEPVFAEAPLAVTRAALLLLHKIKEAPHEHP